MNYLNQPREISIETYAMCNAACVFCPYPTLERKGTRMSDADLLWLIAQMKKWEVPFTISPFKVNEPFLDKRLLTFCAWINHDLPLASLRIFTNGSRFTEEILQRLAKLQNVKHIWVSLNEVDPDKYKATMGLAFNHVAAKLDLLHAAANSYLAHKVIVSRVMLPNQQHITYNELTAREEFNEYVAKRWPLFEPFHIKRDGWIDYTAPSDPHVPRSKCARWEELSIMADGRAALCCMDGTGEYSVGNIHDSDLLAIYNQPKLLALRIGATRRQDFAPCNRCTY